MNETKVFDRIPDRDSGYTDKSAAVAEELRARAGMWRAVRALGWLAFWLILTALVLTTAFGAGIAIQLVGATS